MITIELPKWVPLGGLTLVDTSYQIAADINFTNIVDNHLNDTVNLNTYFSPAVVPANTTYYARVNRKFSDGSTSGWGAPLPITNNVVNGGVVAYTPIVVHQPVVTVDAALNDRLFTNYTITTNAFVGVNEAHGYTVWVVENDQGVIIDYVKSTTALTTLTLNKQPNMHLGTKFIKVSAIHGTLSGIESPAGSVTYDLSLADFSLSVPNPEGAPGINLLVTLIYPATGGVNTVINNVELQDANAAVVWSTPIAPGATSVTIPGELLLSDTQYFIVASGPAVSGAPVSKMIPFHAVPKNNVKRLNPGHVYRKTIRTLGYGRYPSFRAELVSEELYNGKFFENVNGSIVETHITPAGDFVPGTKPYLGLVPMSGARQLNIHMLSGDRIISYYQVGVNAFYQQGAVDFYNNKFVANGPTLQVLAVDVNSNATVIVGGNRLYQANGNVIAVVDITNTGLVHTVANDIALPTGVTSLATMCRGVGDTILIVPTGGTTIQSLDLANNTYTDKYTLPVPFRNRKLSQRQLLNGDVLIWKPIFYEIVNGVGVTETSLELLYIDNKLGTMVSITPYAGRTHNVLASVLRGSGELLLIEANPTGPNVLVFE